MFPGSKLSKFGKSVMLTATTMSFVPALLESAFPVAWSQLLWASTLWRRMRSGFANAAVVGLLMQFAANQLSPGLAQLASCISTVLCNGTVAGDEVFAKVRGPGREMID